MVQTQYDVGLKDEMVKAMRLVFGPGYPDEGNTGLINVELEYPLQAEQYPAIYLTYEPRLIRNAGLGYYYVDTDEEGNEYKARHWYFQGQINFNVMALDPLTRDRLGAGLINLIAFGREEQWFKHFYDELANPQYVFVQLTSDAVVPGGENVSDVPWNNQDEKIYAKTYSVDVLGEFYTVPDSPVNELVRISAVQLLPFRPNQAVPTGDTGNSEDTNIPWVF